MCQREFVAVSVCWSDSLSVCGSAGRVGWSVRGVAGSRDLSHRRSDPKHEHQPPRAAHTQQHTRSPRSTAHSPGTEVRARGNLNSKRRGGRGGRRGGQVYKQPMTACGCCSPTVTMVDVTKQVYASRLMSRSRFMHKFMHKFSRIYVTIRHSFVFLGVFVFL